MNRFMRGYGWGWAVFHVIWAAALVWLFTH